MIFQVSPKLSVYRDLPQIFRQTSLSTRLLNHYYTRRTELETENSKWPREKVSLHHTADKNTICDFSCYVSFSQIFPDQFQIPQVFQVFHKITM